MAGLCVLWSQMRAYRSRIIASVFILLLEEEEEDDWGHWGRVHRFWMREHLHLREDMTTMNTLDKLERYFIKVSHCHN